MAALLLGADLPDDEEFDDEDNDYRPPALESDEEVTTASEDERDESPVNDNGENNGDADFESPRRRGRGRGGRRGGRGRGRGRGEGRGGTRAATGAATNNVAGSSSSASELLSALAESSLAKTARSANLPCPIFTQEFDALIERRRQTFAALARRGKESEAPLKSLRESLDHPKARVAALRKALRVAKENEAETREKYHQMKDTLGKVFDIA